MSTDRGALGAMKALEVASRAGRKDRPAPLACCPYCSELTPLIPTLAFPGAEFYCLECGGHFGFLSPRSSAPTPELSARYEALQAEWDEHAEPRLRLLRGWFESCELCTPGRGEYHVDHATDEEREAHEAALEWLRDRVGGVRNRTAAEGETR